MIPFIDLKTQFERVQAEIEENVLAVLRSGQYIMGPDVKALEDKLSAFTGMKHTVSCASGTDALVIALMAKGIGPGDAVFTTPFTFMATAEAIAFLGATPVFVDIDLDTFNIDPQALERAIERLKGNGSIHPSDREAKKETTPLQPRGIIAVDLFGLPADYEAINAIAEKHNLFVIEDTAQGFGGAFKGKKAGALAEMACTSFFPAKPLGGYGDGGAIFTNDDQLAELFRSIRLHGQGTDRYENVRLGMTGRLDTIQAAILLPKLAIFESELDERQRVASTYARLLDSMNVPLVRPQVPDGYYSAWAQYSLLAKDNAHRQSMIERLKDAGVPTAIYYPKPLHLQKAFAQYGYVVGDFPVSEDAANRVFSVPMHPYLDDATIEKIVSAMV